MSQLESDNKNSDRETLLEPPTSFKCDKRGRKNKKETQAASGFQVEFEDGSGGLSCIWFLHELD